MKKNVRKKVFSCVLAIMMVLSGSLTSAAISYGSGGDSNPTLDVRSVISDLMVPRSGAALDDGEAVLDVRSSLFGITDQEACTITVKPGMKQSYNGYI